MSGQPVIIDVRRMLNKETGERRFSLLVIMKDQARLTNLYGLNQIREMVSGR